MTPVGAPGGRLRVGLVAAGRVGTAVARLLAAAGHEATGVWSRGPASAQRASSLLGARIGELDDVVGGAELVLLGASDDALASMAGAVAQAMTGPVIACHFAGSLGTAPLAPVAAAGGGACALHPVQACPDVATALRRLPGSAWGVTCSPGLEAWASELVRGALGGHPVPVAETDRVLWHASAVTTANGIVALLSAGGAMLEAIGVAAPQGVLAPLAAGAAANVREAGGGGGGAGANQERERGG
ncbi:hypothetical protein BH24ACT26_BH24ACT26_20290 [soil metagenome]